MTLIFALKTQKFPYLYSNSAHKKKLESIFSLSHFFKLFLSRPEVAYDQHVIFVGEVYVNTTITKRN